MTIRRVSTTGNRIKLLSGYHKVGSYLTRRKSILGVVRGEQERFVLEYLVVGGGGGGGAGGGGGGGGGGVIIGSLDAITTGGNVSIGLTGATVFSMGIGAITGNNQDARGNDGNATTFAMSGPNGFSVTALGGGAGGKESDAPNTTLANRNPATVAGGGGQGLNSDHTRSQANQGGQGGIAKVTGRDGPAGRSTTESEGRSGGNPVETTCLSGSISGDVLTLDGPSGNFPGGYFSVGMTLHGGPGNNPDSWLPGTIITAALDQPVAPGGQGTYRISPAPQTVTPRQINAKMNPRGYGGGGGGGSGHTPGPQGEGGNGGGGFDSPILGFNRGYAGGGGGASSSPNNNPRGESGYGGGYGSVKDGGDEIYQAGASPGDNTLYDGNGNLSGPGEGPTGPRGAFPLPPFGPKVGYGPRESGPYPTGGYRYPGVGQQRNALNNRGGGGGGAWSSSFYRDWGSLGPNGESGPFISNLAEPRNLWSENANPPPHAFAPLWPTDTGTRNWPGRAGFRQGGRGGSGIVVIRYPSVFGNTTTTGTPIKTRIDSGWLVHQFVDSGSMTLDFSAASRIAATITSGPAYGTPATPGVISYLYVGGGGGGGQGAGDTYGAGGGGGGAGAFTTGTVSLVNGAGTYTVVIGAGGSSDSVGQNTGIFNASTGTRFGSPYGSVVWANGGGYGGGQGRSPGINVPGGSGPSGGGGMGAYPAGSTNAGGAGSPQYNGGSSGSNSPNPFASPFFSGGGGGGGSGAAGANGDAYNGGNGGTGTSSSITGSPVTYTGGGGGGAYTGHFGPEGPLRVFGGTSGNGGTNGGPSGSPGGGGGGGGTPRGFAGTAGTPNTGGGGGGGASAFAGSGGGNGGSGVVILSYPNEYANVETLIGASYSEVNGQRILRFAGSGSFTLGLPYDAG